jgi:hypothetical protein
MEGDVSTDSEPISCVLIMTHDLSMAGTERVSREEILSMISSAVLSEYYCTAAFELQPRLEKIVDGAESFALMAARAMSAHDGRRRGGGALAAATPCPRTLAWLEA